MAGYANRYTDADPVNGFIADPRRVVIGMFVAPAVGALATEVQTFRFEGYWAVALLGWLSVITLYLPLVLWRLRRTRRPFLTCVLIGAISAPGLLGYAYMLIGALAVGPFAMIIAAATFPLGAIGGAMFWLCAIWRSEGFETFSDV